jgi:hypothetical protein
LHAADGRIFGRIEREYPARAKRVGMSRTVGDGFRRTQANKPIVCFWHLADIQPSSGNVRFWG